MFEKIRLIFNTVKYMRLSQIYYYVLRRKLGSKRVRLQGNCLPRESLDITKPLAIEGVISSDWSFTFLNKKKHLGRPGEIIWNPNSVHRLWAYNLHYFDFLRQPSVATEVKFELIEDWIARNPLDSKPAWEPFTVSLRIVNWVFFLIENQGYRAQTVLKSLYLQALWLQANDERHILANHYFENLKALLFAGVFFQGKDAELWIEKSLSNLIDQLDEQLLPDGGHYERSPQYHDIMLENYIDILNLAISNRFLFDDRFLDKLRKCAICAIGFSSKIRLPDKTIPQINDTALGISTDLDDLLEYYNIVTQESLKEKKHTGIIDCHSSGFLGFKSEDSYVIVDAGDIQPSYQPGHSHCNMLGYELMLNREKIVVDTGVREYEPGENRDFSRRTAEHNTISVDAAEQSEIWGEFRIGRRAKMQSSRVFESDGKIYFNGKYTGFPCIKAGIDHTRDITLQLNESQSIQSISICDSVSGKTRMSHQVRSSLKFHPDIVIEQTEFNSFVLVTNNGREYLLDVLGDVDSRVVKSEYFPYFGVTCETSKLVLEYIGKLPVSISYQIKELVRPTVI